MPQAASEYDFVLACVDDILVLRNNSDLRLRPTFVDLKAVRARSYPAPKGGPFATAVGRRNKFVVDATAGLGKDMLMLFAMGYRVLAIERSPVIAALLQDGLRRLQSEPCVTQSILTTPTLHFGDAGAALEALTEAPDCVYLDPMFPLKTKRSALVRRDLRALRKIVGADDDASRLFDIAFRVTRNRVVVKRADDAPPLVSGPDNVYRANTVRYDVYLKY
ncbi:MAG: class I SAM-dependent methyltransferase [Gammaproteobacteria bacterium]|nr:class I SAM-dependent methyltransferase [Gammaproteobacteria bacterium]